MAGRWTSTESFQFPEMLTVDPSPAEWSDLENVVALKVLLAYLCSSTAAYCPSKIPASVDIKF